MEGSVREKKPLNEKGGWAQGGASTGRRLALRGKKIGEAGRDQKKREGELRKGARGRLEGKTFFDREGEAPTNTTQGRRIGEPLMERKGLQRKLRWNHCRGKRF